MTTLTMMVDKLRSGNIEGFECYSEIMGREILWYRLRKWGTGGFQLKQVSYQMGPAQEGSGIYGTFDDLSPIYGMHEGSLHSKKYLQKQGKRLFEEGRKDAFEKVKDAHLPMFRELAAATPCFEELKVEDASDIIDAIMETAKQRDEWDQEDRESKKTRIYNF